MRFFYDALPAAARTAVLAVDMQSLLEKVFAPVLSLSFFTLKSSGEAVADLG